MTEFKSVRIGIKSDMDTEGVFSGMLSTYGNVDESGDVCVVGCFAKDLAVNGTKRPLLWQHNPDRPIGSFEANETESGLAIAGRYNLDTVQGREAYALTKAGDISGLSIGYIVKDSGYDDEGHRLLKDLDLMEGSVVTFPCNRQAVLTSVKSGDAVTLEDIEKRLKACEDALSRLTEEKDGNEPGKNEEGGPKDEDVPDENDDEEKSLNEALNRFERLTKNNKE